jgi:hypothetical protein
VQPLAPGTLPYSPQPGAGARYWQAALHDMQGGRVSGVALSFDEAFCLSACRDGTLYLQVRCGSMGICLGVLDVLALYRACDLIQHTDGGNCDHVWDCAVLRVLRCVVSGWVDVPTVKQGLPK